MDFEEKELLVFYFKDLLRSGRPMTEKEIEDEVEIVRSHENKEIIYDMDGETAIGFIQIFADEEDPDRAWKERE